MVNLDFPKATEIYENMTDLQRIWLDTIIKEEERKERTAIDLRKTRDKVWRSRGTRSRR